MKSVVLTLAMVLLAAPLFAQEKKGKPMSWYQARAATNDALLKELNASKDIAQTKQYRAKWAAAPKLISNTLLAPVPAEADPDEFGKNLDEIFALNLGPYVRQSLQLVIPIYTFGRIRAAQELAALGVDVEELKARQTTEDAVFKTAQAYYALQLSAAFDSLLGEGGAIIKEKLKEIEEAREFGESDVDVKDLRKLQIFDAEVDARLLENQKLRKIAEAGMLYLADTKEAPVVPELSTSGELPELKDLASYQALAREKRVEVLLLQRAGLATAAAKKLAHRNWYPNIALASEFAVGWSTEDVAPSAVCRDIRGDCVDTSDLFARPSSNPLNFLSFTIGLGMRWEFDYWQLRGKYREAEARERQVSGQAERALGAIDLEVQKLWIDAEEASKRVEVTARRLQAARRWRDQFGLKLSTGGGDLADAVDPLKAYFESKALNLQARFDYLVAYEALRKGTGTLEIPTVSE